MLTERQKFILTVVIDDFIRCAEPIGSRSVSRRSDIGCSPATIRNEMSDLEALGYLEQPHPSAGRIPSQKGYRYYVDHLLQPDLMHPQEMQRIKSFFAQRMAEMELLVQQAATVLSQLTQYTAFVLGPDTHQHTLASLQWLPVDDHVAVALLITNRGHVESRRILMPRGVRAEQVEQLVRMVNEQLKGIPMHQLAEAMIQAFRMQWDHQVDEHTEVLALIDALMPQSSLGEKVYWGGATQLLRHSEFQSVETCCALLHALEQTPTWRRLTAELPVGLNVSIGEENSWQAIQACTMITATYRTEEDMVGTIGILGPTRMDYRRVMAILQNFAQALSEQFLPLDKRRTSSTDRPYRSSQDENNDRHNEQKRKGRGI